MTVDGLNLAMRRGDSEELSVGLTGYDLQSGDFIEMTVRKTLNGPVAVYKKLESFQGNEAIFKFAPADTQNLQPGDYVYDIQLTFGGRVKTIVPEDPDEENPTFYIGGDVTHG